MDVVGKLACAMARHSVRVEPTEVDGVSALCGKTYPFKETFMRWGLLYEGRRWLFHTDEPPAELSCAIMFSKGR